MILDGYGISFLEEGNAILAANMVNMKRYLREYPAAVIKASSIEVGLPWGEVGNSETGHKNIGSGRIIYQPLPQITLAIRDKAFSQNPAFIEAASHVKQQPDAALHLMGCVSNGGVHSHVEHLLALLEFAKQQGIGDRTFIHAFLDGRDTPPVSAGMFLSLVDKTIQGTKSGTICSLIGRYYAMDRNNNWDRTQAAYDLIVHGVGEKADSWKAALEAAYEQQKTDETVPAMVITKGEQPIRTVRDGDAIIFFNFRPDRARQLSYAFVKKDFHKFPVERWESVDVVTMAGYEKDLPVTVAFPEEQAEFPVGRVVADAGLRQLRIAETEKYAHVTYYFNSGRELPYPGEDRVIIPSPNVKDYATTPKMSAGPITDRVIQEIEKGKYDLIVMNYANPDMIGHTGKFEPTVEGLKFLDEQIRRVVDATLTAGGAVLLTCDHGNAEEKVNPSTHEATTDHTSNPVPIIYIAANTHQDSPKSDDLLFQILSSPIGVLADIGPTAIEILGIPQVPQMTAQSLLQSLV
jgi:2,3-bisphosphoglycerate-independent phosphoglycerate mutase